MRSVGASKLAQLELEKVTAKGPPKTEEAAKVAQYREYRMSQALELEAQGR